MTEEWNLEGEDLAFLCDFWEAFDLYKSSMISTVTNCQFNPDFQKEKSDRLINRNFKLKLCETISVTTLIKFS